MFRLTAIKPQRCFDLHWHAEYWYHTGTIRSSYIHESTEDSCTVGALTNRYAWCVEGRLGDGVVPACELELDYIAYVGFDIIGKVFYGIIGSGTNTYDVGCGGGVGSSWEG